MNISTLYYKEEEYIYRCYKRKIALHQSTFQKSTTSQKQKFGFLTKIFVGMLFIRCQQAVDKMCKKSINASYDQV